jgi:type I restriction enzyme S subunit
VKFYRETEFQDTEIGKIPKDWKTAKLREICKKIKAGGTPLTTKKEYWNGNIPFVKIEDMTSSGKYLMKTSSSITNTGLENSSAWLVPENSLLLAMYGSLGEVSINTIKVATSQAILAIIPIEKNDVEFLYYWFLYFKPRWRKYAKPTTQANLTAEIVRNSTIPLPPPQERIKIAEILSTVDKTIEDVDKTINRLERLKKALMGELLAGRIRVKEVDGKLTFYRETEFQETEIGKIPIDWRIAKLGEIAVSRKEIVYPQQEESSTPYVGLEHIMSGEIRLRRFGNISDVRSAKMKFYKGDILYGKLRPYLDKAVLANIDGVCSTDIIVIKTKKDIIPEFLIYVLHSKKFIKHAISTMRGTNHPRTSWESIARFKIGVPPLQEQRKIAEVLSAVDRAIELYINERGKLEKVKNGLMSVLLTGKVRVRDD